MKHTKGPWKVLSGNYGGVTSINASISERICSLKETIDPKDGNSTNYKANANLIATAPELKESGHIIAILILQSDFYKKDYEIRQAVDNFLAIEARAEGRCKEG